MLQYNIFSRKTLVKTIELLHTDILMLYDPTNCLAKMTPNLSLVYQNSINDSLLPIVHQITDKDIYAIPIVLQ